MITGGQEHARSVEGGSSSSGTYGFYAPYEFQSGYVYDGLYRVKVLDRLTIIGSPDTHTDIHTTSLSEARSYLAGVAVGSVIVFAGGRNSAGIYVDTVDIYNPSTDQVMASSSMSIARSALTAASSG